MIKAVIFDLDDTLYDYETLNQKAWNKVEKFTCERLGISAGQYREAYQFGRRETKNRLPDVGASHNRLLYCQKALEYLQKPPIPLSLQMYEQYWGTFLEEMHPFPGVKETLALLRERQIPVMICTDLTAHIQHRKIDALGIAEDVRYLVSSEEAGREKPSREIFRLCLEKLNLPPENVWCVGDGLEKDVKGALRAGMQAVWFHPGGEIQEKTVQTEEGQYTEIQNYRQCRDLFVRNLATQNHGGQYEIIGSSAMLQ